MASVKSNTTIKEYQNFVKEVYGLCNDRDFSVGDMLANVERFVMRGLKGIRKKDPEKTKLNLMIALSWFVSLMNQLHIDLGNEVWQRFPYVCSYCGVCPCICWARKIKIRQKISRNDRLRPNTLSDFQKMFKKIYPPQGRSLEHEGVHLAEETGELSEAILKYRGAHQEEDFNEIALEAADFFSCLAGVFNSLDFDIARQLAANFSHNCHVCKKAPCQCSFIDIVRFKS